MRSRINVEPEMPSVELVQDDAYRRTIRIGGLASVIDIRRDQNEPGLVLSTDFIPPDTYVQRDVVSLKMDGCELTTTSCSGGRWRWGRRRRTRL